MVLKRQGMPDPRGGLPGDLHVQLNIDVPKKVTDEQEALIRELAEMEHANVTPHRKSFLDKLKEYFVSHETSASDEG
jgi:molecular chaperone DnaJ